jgi:hypothetical protein
MRYHLIGAFKMTTAPSASEQSRSPTWWRAFGYIAAVAPFVFMVGLARLRPDLNRMEIPDWRPVLVLADLSRQKGDLYEARHLYLQVERIASWRRDWEGLVAAACGFKRLDRAEGPYSKTFAILVRAMIAAESKQSRSSMASVAKAFTALGEPKAASMALARVRPEWPAEAEVPAESLLAGCRPPS